MRALQNTISKINTKKEYFITDTSAIFLTEDEKYYVFVMDYNENDTHSHYWPLTGTVKSNINL